MCIFVRFYVLYMSIMKVKIGIIGDSISLGYGLAPEEESYVDLLVKLDLFEVSVFAKCGNDLDTVFNDLNLISKGADIWIIFLGTNGCIEREKLLSIIQYFKTIENHIIVCNLMIDSENNTIIYSIPIEEGIIICDLKKQSKNKEELLQKDNIHPNIKGHRVIFNELLRIINLWEI